jgi:hypothetical protein
MPRAGFESTYPVTERKTYALDRAATGIGEVLNARQFNRPVCTTLVEYVSTPLNVLFRI